VDRIRSFRAAFVRGDAPASNQARLERDDFPEIDGSSVAVRALKREMRLVARDPDVTALIVGESGTGKERVAQAIHRASARAAAPFVVIDCAGLAATLAEDTLFGHVRGAFTGAIAERAGPFERADGGTVLLDEIGDLPLDLQMKLLRAIQSRAVQRLGARQDTPFDVRVIAATNVDLEAAVARGRFREDLYYRLKVFEIRVPPLRRRGAEDIRALAASILHRLAQRRRREPPAIDPEALERLVTSPWPGNVRELENVLERMLVAAAGEPVLRVVHLPGGRGVGSQPVPLRAEPSAAVRILDALQRNGFRYGRTAADLGLSRHQLYRLVRQHGIRAPATDR
jgi:two-component system, NtrC family, response regulator HydG